MSEIIVSKGDIISRNSYAQIIIDDKIYVYINTNNECKA
jgi:hypothetical protein